MRKRKRGSDYYATVSAPPVLAPEDEEAVDRLLTRPKRRGCVWCQVKEGDPAANSYCSVDPRGKHMMGKLP